MVEYKMTAAAPNNPAKNSHTITSNILIRGRRTESKNEEGEGRYEVRETRDWAGLEKGKEPSSQCKQPRPRH